MSERRLSRPSSMLLRLLMIAVLGVGWAACGDDDSVGGDDGGLGDAGGDADLVDAQEPDAEVTSPCPVPVLLDTDIELDPDGPDTQIHASVAFDGEGLWAAYNLPDATGFFDVWGVHLSCDGEIDRAPRVLQTITENNEVDPAVAVGGDKLYVVWGADNGTGVNNMDAFYRTFQIDGTPIMAAEEILETTRDGTPIPGNVMFPTLDAEDGDSFWVAAIRGLDATGTFHFFLQEIDADGSLLGEALEPITEPGVTHTNPALEVSAQGDVFMGWSRAEGTGDEEIHHTYLLSGHQDPEPPVAALDGVVASNVAFWAGELGGARRVVMAVGAASGNILLTDGEALDPSGEFVFVGDGMGRDHSPALAGWEEGGVVAFYRNISGLQNELIVQPFTYDGVAFDVGSEVVVTQGPAAPYGVALTALGDGYYFLVWSQGISPDFRLVGRFIYIDP